MYKIKQKKRHRIVEDLKNQVYGFCWDKQGGVQICYSPDRDEELPEKGGERAKGIFNTYMTMWGSAIALIMLLRKMLIEYEPNLADTMPITPLMNNPENQPAKVNVLKGKLWELPYGFYMDNEQGLWLWVDSENMQKKDIVEALDELMECAKWCMTTICTLMAGEFPGFRKLLADSGIYPEYKVAIP